jgi:hypothetical protein
LINLVRKDQQPPWIVPHELWARIQPLLPVVVPRRSDRPGRPRLDDRWPQAVAQTLFDGGKPLTGSCRGLPAGSPEWNPGDAHELSCWVCSRACPAKTCWTISEHVGDDGPLRMQHRLRKAVWDADAVRDDIRTIAVECLGSAEAILVVDETGDVKKGKHTVGATAIHRHRGPDRERPGRGVSHLHHRCRAHADRPGVVSAEILDW